jgi:hypothetical protein
MTTTKEDAEEAFKSKPTPAPAPTSYASKSSKPFELISSG